VQGQKIGIVSDSAMKNNTDLYQILKKDITALGTYLEKFVLEAESEAMQAYYQEVMKRIGHGCGFDYRYEQEAEEELQARQDSLQKMAAIADEELIAYEAYWLDLLDQELKKAAATVAQKEGYDLIIITDGVLYMDDDKLSPMIINQVNQQIVNQDFQRLVQPQWKRVIRRVKAKKFRKTLRPREQKNYLVKHTIFSRLLLMLHGTGYRFY